VAALDVSAAANAWLARLPESERLAAQTATDVRLAGFLVGAAVFAAVAALVMRAGLIDALICRIEAGRPRPWLASAAAAGVLTLVLAVPMALVNAFTAWRVGAALTAGGGAPADAGLVAHLAAAASGIAPAVTAAVILAPPAAWLMRRAPRTWPLMAGAAGAALILALLWLPYVLSVETASSRAPPGPTRDAVAQLVARTDLPATGIWFDSDPGFDVDVTGGFGHARVAIGPKLTAMPTAEARAITAHVMGHYAHSDILLACLAAAAAIVLGLVAARQWGAALARALGAGRVDSAAEPAAMPALAIIGAATLTLAWLAFAGYLRWANVRADAYSLDQARAPDGLAAVIEREWDHNAVAPSPLETALFYSHPPLRDRIAHAMAWKAAHGG